LGERSFFVNPTSIHEGRADLVGPVAHQIRNVLRLRPGDEVELLDGSGLVLVARLSKVSKEGVVAEIVESRWSDSEPEVELVLYQALLKGQKMELVLQKGTEIGVSRFVPVLSDRCISRPDARDMARRLERWGSVVREAAEQSGRAVLPVVAGLVRLEDGCREAASRGPLLMAWEGEHQLGVRGALTEAGLVAVASDERAGRRGGLVVSLLVGPEGGFSEQEVEAARAAGAVTVGLGPRILRAETAGLVAATLVLCHLGELDG